tara:strand:+ start:737 stop:1063 length:327 start_codon:yes stop_codon:yes gene_type:complete
MKKIFCFLTLFALLNGCAESMALLGSSATNGRVVQSSINTALSYGVKQRTGKTPLQHAFNYGEKNKAKKTASKNKIQPCVEFLEPVSKDFCAVIKSKILKLSKVQSLD